MVTMKELFAALPDIKFQYLHQCVTNVRTVERVGKKRVPRHTLVTFATQECEPSNFLGRGEMDQVGIVVWIPREDYNKAVGEP